VWDTMPKPGCKNQWGVPYERILQLKDSKIPVYSRVTLPAPELIEGGAKVATVTPY